MKRAQLSLLFFSLLFAFPACHFFQKDLVVLKIGTKEWTSKNFAKRLVQKIRSLRLEEEAEKQDSLEKIKSLLIGDLLIEELIYQQAKRKNLSVPKQELDHKLLEIKKKYPNEQIFKMVLLKHQMKQKEWEKSILLLLLSQKVSQNLSSQHEKPSEEEMKNYYKENIDSFVRPARIFIRHIFNKEKDLLNQAMQELQQGKDFKVVAKKFSQTGGSENPEWIKKGTSKTFDQAFFLRKGQKSPILSSVHGYHIVEVLDKQKKTKLKWDEAKERIAQILNMLKQRALFKAWLDKQRKKIHIFKNEEALNKIKVKVL